MTTERISSSRENYLDWLQQHIQADLDTAGVPGLALAILEGRRIVFAEGFGTTRCDAKGVEVTPETLFRVASVTKPLTGTLLMRLVEAGIVALDTPICAYIPWLTLRDADAAQTITLRMLLSHTSGLPFEYVLTGSADAGALEKYVRDNLPRLPLVAAPGTQWHYSNPGLNLAGYVAEVVSGRFFPDLMQQYVFAPLDMTHTTFDVGAAQGFSIACSHTPQEDGSLRVEAGLWNRRAGQPSGGAFSCVLDLANFAIMQINKGWFGGQQFLPPASVAVMQTPQVATSNDPQERYGLTFFVNSYRGQSRVAHWGGVEGYGSRLALLPEAGLGVVMLYNRLASSFDPDSLIDIILDRCLYEK